MTQTMQSKLDDVRQGLNRLEVEESYAEKVAFVNDVLEDVATNAVEAEVAGAKRLLAIRGVGRVAVLEILARVGQQIVLAEERRAG